MWTRHNIFRTVSWAAFLSLPVVASGAEPTAGSAVTSAATQVAPSKSEYIAEKPAAQQTTLEWQGMRYRIQPGDVLLISVWKEQDLQQEVLVRPDGGLSFPLAGEIVVNGYSIEELRLELLKRIREYIPEAVVTVSVKAIGGNRIYVIGKVNRPGEYLFTRPVDVMQALSLAGGATAYAAVNDIRILRRESGFQTALPFRYSEVERGRYLEQNIELRSGDTVVVP